MTAEDSTTRQDGSRDGGVTTSISTVPASVSMSSSKHVIPTYPTKDIAQPSPAVGMGILHHPPSDTAQLSRPRMSLSYADQPRPARGENASSATNDSDLARHRRSHSRTRSSIDVIRRSLSLVRLPESGQPVDPMAEPRRSISKRPDELLLAERDPHHQHQQQQQQQQQRGHLEKNLVKPKQTHPIRRVVPFAAPYVRSGVVLSQPSTLRSWAIPGPLTFGYGQWWYLFFAQSLVAAIISGAINFGVAVALYRTQPTINIWTFDRQTVAGDMGVTVIIQQIVSFIITSSLVHHDLYAGPIGPLRRPWPPLLHLPSTPNSEGHWLGVKMPEDVASVGGKLYMGRAEGQGRIKSWWWWFVRAVLTGSERNDLLAAGISWRQRSERLVWTAGQGFFLCVLTFWWYWPLAIAIVAPLYEHTELAGTWIPMIIKLVYGGVLSLLTNPIMALMAMGAESSVRRCYPELEIWEPFGGREDFVRWKVEQGIMEEENGESLDDVQETTMGSSSDGVQDSPQAAAAAAGGTPTIVSEETGSGVAYQTNNLLQRRITEEPTSTPAPPVSLQK
ncbi:uncharacterized protein UTRI_01178_B [Ustilago trichophora]|uniref:Uncharacterized protein n=1 Tax=Ustilago trichophora TaxID=86804 RepID=A0A5C3DWX2_9BASI|nr:uncharacterized protein UTRI_01178_B [Ustilago trichophora]